MSLRKDKRSPIVGNDLRLEATCVIEKGQVVTLSGLLPMSEAVCVTEKGQEITDSSCDLCMKLHVSLAKGCKITHSGMCHMSEATCVTEKGQVVIHSGSSEGRSLVKYNH